ncbi:hypothetical protein [Luteibacter jiangsuensis]
MSRRRTAWLPRIALVWLVASLTGCASVASVGKRVDGGDEIVVRKLALYSFAPLHSMGSERLRRDARRLDGELARHLAAHDVETVVTDVDGSVRRHALAIDVRVADGEGMRRSSLLPERELLEAQRSEESTAGVTHRLVIVPLRLNVDAGTGVAHGVLRWRVEAVDGPSTVAVGLMRYTADARGYPSKRMATLLVAKLRSLGIR